MILLLKLTFLNIENSTIQLISFNLFLYFSVP